jgi:hypothetical protein
MRQKVKHAVINEQNVVFAVVQVKEGVVQASQTTAVDLINLLSPWYRCPVVLMGEESARLSGRGDLVNFLSGLSPSQIPWREEIVDYAATG